MISYKFNLSPDPTRPATLENLLFTAIVSVLIAFVFCTKPFLKIPYDMWDHMIRIVSLHDEGKCFLFYPEQLRTRFVWHSIWATVFKTGQIQDFFLRTRIIHISQFLLAVLSVYFYSTISLRVLFPSVRLNHIKYLALIAVISWTIGNGTFSEQYQQAWIMWYSLTPQGLTIPIFWIITAITIRNLYEPITKKLYILNIIIIGIGCVLIAKIHPMELIYYALHIALFLSFTWTTIPSQTRKQLKIIIPVGVVIFFLFAFLMDENVYIFSIFRQGGPRGIYLEMRKVGYLLVVERLNRFPNSYSEIAVSALILGIIFRIWSIFKIKEITFNRKYFDYVLSISVLFFLVGTTKFFGSLFALITNYPTIFRYFFAAPWFLVLPFVAYMVCIHISPNQLLLTKAITISITIIGIIVLSSKIFLSHAVYENVRSIVSAVHEERPFQFTREEISTLGQIVFSRDIKYDKPNMFYLRGDLAYLVRAVFGKYVFMERFYTPPREAFLDHSIREKYHFVELDCDDQFRKDAEVFKSYDFRRKSSMH